MILHLYDSWFIYYHCGKFDIDWRGRRYSKTALFASFLFYATHYVASTSISNYCMNIDFLSNRQYFIEKFEFLYN